MKTKESQYHDAIQKELRAMIVEETANEVQALRLGGRGGAAVYRENANAARAAYYSPALIARLAKFMAYESDKAYALAAEVYEKGENT